MTTKTKTAKTKSPKNIFFIQSKTGDLAAFFRAPHGAKKASLGGTSPLVILAHGFSGSATMAESVRLFYDTAQKLSDAGMGALLFDFMGQGLSDGAFAEMTPNTRLRDLSAVINYAKKHHKGKIALLGLSMGGAIAVHAALKHQKDLSALATWSCVPALEKSHPSVGWYLKNMDDTKVDRISRRFTTDQPRMSVGQAYQKITLPKLQVQGDHDLPHFASTFAGFFKTAPAPKKYILLKGGDHVFTNKKVRARVINTTVSWLADMLL